MSSQPASSRIEERPYTEQDLSAVAGVAHTSGGVELYEDNSPVMQAAGKGQLGVVTTPAEALAYFNHYHVPNPRVQISGSLAAAILRDSSGIGARVWHILRLFTPNGSMSKAVAIWLLSNRKSPVRIFSKRWAYKLLARFDSLYWNLTEDDWLRLTSEAKLAFLLEMKHFTRHVLVSLKDLTAGMRRFNAVLHDASLASSSGKTIISRAKQEERTGVSRVRQRYYEKEEGTHVQQNYVIGVPINYPKGLQQKGVEEQLIGHYRKYQGRNGAYIHEDRQGVLGKAGCRYIAWQTANTYCSVHELAPKGKTKRLNKKLKALGYKMGTQQDSTSFGRVFFPDGGRYAKAISRATGDCFVPCPGVRNGQTSGGAGLWFQIK